MCIVGKRILVVEDTPSISLYLQANLKMEGANVTVADCTEQALSEFETAASSAFPFELLLVDLNLPDLDGTTLLSKASISEEQPTRIAMSADGSRENIAKAYAAGAELFFEKPFDISKLKRAMSDRLHERDIVTHHTEPVDTTENSRELTNNYTSYLKGLTTKLEKQIGYKELRSLVHQLKGSAALYALQTLSDEAAECSKLLATGGPHNSQKVRNTLQNHIKDAIEELEK
ncbi:MAG: response regulator [Kordiimonas sp.]